MFSFHVINPVTLELRNKDRSNYLLFFFSAAVGQLVNMVEINMNMVEIKT